MPPSSNLSHEAEQAQRRYNDDVDKLKQQLADSEKKLGEQTSQLEAAQTNHNEATAELGRVREELSTAQDELAQARSELFSAQTEVRLVNVRVTEANSARNTMKIDLIAGSMELATTRYQLQKSMEANEKAVEQVDTARETLEACTSVIFDLEEQRDAVTGQLTVEQSKYSHLEEELRQSQVELHQTKTDLERTKADLEKNKADLQQSDAELRQSQEELQRTKTICKNVEAQKKGIASFFAGHAGLDASDTVVPAIWRPLVTALSSADWIAGIPVEEGRATWTLLPIWYGDNLAPLPYPPLVLLELLLRVHAASVSGDFDRETSDRVRHLTDVLAQASSLPVGLLAEIANRALDTLASHDGHFSQSLEKQIFNMALRQLLQLCRNRWPSPEVEQLLGRTERLVQEHSFLCIKELEEQLGDGNDASLLQHLADSRDADGEVPDRDGAFFLSGGTIGLLRAAEDHIWAFNLDAHTVRLIHATRGTMIRDVQYILRSSESAGGSPDLIIPIEQDGEYFWCMHEWGRAIESGGCDMSQLSGMSQ
ncbi:hypothetical protein PG996_013711 [Apiospora saccharicola]|uniref:Uncharacterized protein n=1 Tax=Apiospora saccharicola TaxID=335842 RepID=A0ABR1U8I8_9PEZI